MPLPALATVNEVATSLGVTPEYVRTELIGKGRVRAVRLTRRGRWRIDVASVEELVGEKRRTSEPKLDRRRAVMAYVKAHGELPKHCNVDEYL